LRKEQEDFLALQKKQLTLGARENGVLQQLQEKTASYNELKITHCKYQKQKQEEIEELKISIKRIKKENDR
jgi:hypothetical protein